MKPVVGLTGGIGSGKNAVAELFVALGVPVIDVDVIAHELTVARGLAMPAITKEFGDSVLTLDGGLDRAAMRTLVFADPAARTRLETLLHPMIRQESDRRVQAALVRIPAGYVVLMVPLLVESNSYRDRVRRIVVVDCAEETQIQRVMKRNGLARDEVLRIIKVQASRSARLAVADDVIENDGAIDQLPPQVLRVHEKCLKSLANIGLCGSGPAAQSDDMSRVT